MSLWTIFTTMVMAGLSAVGGAWGTIAVAQTSWVGPGMLSPEQFAWAVSIGQITPGPLAVLVVALGYQLRHLAGAVVALAGILLPTWVASQFAARGLQRYRAAVLPYGVGIPWILAGLAATSGVRLALPLHLSVWEVGVGVAAFLAVGWKRIEAPWVLIAAAVAGGVLALVR